MWLKGNRKESSNEKKNANSMNNRGMPDIFRSPGDIIVSKGNEVCGLVEITTSGGNC